MVSELTWDDDGMGGWLLSETTGRVSASVTESGGGWRWSALHGGWDIASGECPTPVDAKERALAAIIKWARREAESLDAVAQAAWRAATARL